MECAGTATSVQPLRAAGVRTSQHARSRNATSIPCARYLVALSLASERAMPSQNIRIAVTEFCQECALLRERNAIFSGDAECLDIVEACSMTVCKLHAVRPRKGQN